MSQTPGCNMRTSLHVVSNAVSDNIPLVMFIHGRKLRGSAGSQELSKKVDFWSFQVISSVYEMFSGRGNFCMLVHSNTSFCIVNRISLACFKSSILTTWVRP